MVVERVVLTELLLTKSMVDLKGEMMECSWVVQLAY